jgi:hypothetical protein
MKTLFVEYTQVSTIAGLHYAFKAKQSLMGRVIWIIAVAILTFLGFWLSLQNYVQWKKDPVLTTITTTGLKHFFAYFSVLCSNQLQQLRMKRFFLLSGISLHRPNLQIVDVSFLCRF